MQGQPVGKGKVYTILCRCRAQIAVEAGAFGRPQACPRCRATFTVAWGRDPKTRMQAPVAVAQARKSAGRSATRPAGAALELVCSCGYRRAARPEEAHKSPRCPGCGKWMIVGQAPAAPRREPSREPAPSPDPALSMALSCSCGYRRAVRPEQARKNTRCPGCGKWMIVEKPRPVAPPPSPVSVPTKPPTPVPLSPARPYHSQTLVAAESAECPCGERVLVRSGLVGKEAKCPACGRVLKLETFRDPQTFLTRIRASAAQIDSAAPVASLDLVARLASEAPPPPGTPEAECPCGQRLSIPLSKAGRQYTCPGCGRTVKIEKTKQPQTMAITFQAVFGPSREEPPPQAAPTPRTAPAAPPSIPETPAPAAPPSAAQEVICQCGEELLVGPEDFGQHIQCPTCNVVMQLEEIRDPHTGGSTLRAQVIGRMDEETWSLADFS